MDDDTSLTDAERAALRALKRDVEPPEWIEQAVFERLTHPRATPRVRWLRMAGSATALAASFVLGVVLSRPAPGAPEPAGNQFMLLLLDGEERPGENLRQEYERWAGGLASEGRLVGGNELANLGVAVTPNGAGGDVDVALKGYFVVTARDIDEARRVASTCPHLVYGGRVVVRPIIS